MVENKSTVMKVVVAKKKKYSTALFVSVQQNKFGKENVYQSVIRNSRFSISFTIHDFTKSTFFQSYRMTKSLKICKKTLTKVSEHCFVARGFRIKLK